MRRYLFDTGIAGYYIDRRLSVFEKARAEVTLGNWIGIAHPVLAELAYRVECSQNRARNLQRLQTGPHNLEAMAGHGRSRFRIRPNRSGTSPPRETDRAK